MMDRNLALINAAIPLPWTPVRIYDQNGWSHEVLSGEGKAHDRYTTDRDQNARIAATIAIAPEALDYVIRAAAKGGAEAISIAERFRSSLTALDTRKKPEEAARRPIGATS